MRHGNIPLGTPLFLLLVMALSACDSGHRTLGRARSGTSIGQPFPAFQANTLDGGTVDNSIFQNKVTLVSAWRIGCEWSQVEIEEYNRMQGAITDPRFQMISMAPHTAGELQKIYQDSRSGSSVHVPGYDVLAMCTEQDVLVDDIGEGRCARLEALVGAEVYPITFVVGPDGVIRHRHDGLLVDATTFEPDMSVFKQELDSLLRVL